MVGNAGVTLLMAGLDTAAALPRPETSAFTTEVATAAVEGTGGVFVVTAAGGVFVATTTLEGCAALDASDEPTSAELALPLAVPDRVVPVPVPVELASAGADEDALDDTATGLADGLASTALTTGPTTGSWGRGWGRAEVSVAKHVHRKKALRSEGREKDGKGYVYVCEGCEDRGGGRA